jgi:hypothetical protein
MQSILIPQGAPVVASDIQEILTFLASPGILQGMSLIAANASAIGLTPGAALTDSGIIIYETEQQTIPFTASVNSANYTIYYSYTPNNNYGGQTGQLSIQKGLIAPENFSNGVLLGWLVYPGGSVQLNGSMFISAPRLKLTEDVVKTQGNFLMHYPPFSSKLVQSYLSGPQPTLSDLWDGTNNLPYSQWINPSGSVSTSIYNLPFSVPYQGLGQIQIECQTQTGSMLTVNILRRNGQVIAPTPINFFTNTAMQKQTLSIPQGVLGANEDLVLQMRFEIQPTYSIIIRSIGLSCYTEPF